MIDDPYKILGISEGATPDEIKKAYRKKAKEYHPDLHPDDPVAAQKMNEVNKAYDMLQNPGKYRARAERQAQGGGYGYQGGYSYGTGDFYDFDFGDIFGFGGMGYDTTPQVQQGDSRELINAIGAVQSRNFTGAVSILMSMADTYRNDRWYYVCAYAYMGMSDNTRAQEMIEKAIQANPENRVYRQLRQEIMQKSANRTTAYTQRTFSPFGCLWRTLGFMLLMRIISFLLNFLMFGFSG